MPLNYIDPWEGRVPSLKDSASNQVAPTEKQNSGIFGDFVDAVQQGAYQSAAGDAEAVGQISDSDTFKSIGKALAKGANSQTDTMTGDAQQALSQHIFKDDPDSFTGVAFDDGATNWRTWALQFGVLGGQVAANLATGFGAGTVVKLGAKQVIKSVAKKAITKEAQQLVAKNAVKEAIRNGALDDVRAALIAAPDKAAMNAVLNKATSRIGGIATTAVAGSMAAGMRAQQARDEYLGLDVDTLNQNPEFQKAYWEIADNPENQGLDTATIHNAAKEMLAEKAATTAFFDKKALLSDLASGAYVPGAGGVIGRGAATASKMGRFGIGLAKEGAPEAWQGGETQRAVNEAIKEWGDESRDPMANVVRTRWEEGTLGGVFGGMAKVVEGQHVAPSKPIVTVENPPSTGNSTLDSALAQSNADEQSRYDTLTGHVDELSKPAYMRNGDISPELENAIAQFRLDAMQQQQAQQRKDGIMQPFDNPVAGNPDEPAFLRSRNFNPTGRDLTGNEDVNPESPVQQALARSAGQDRSLESQLADTMANGDQGKTPQEDFVTGEWLRWDQRQPMSEPNRIESGVTMPGESREIFPESRGLGYNNQINMPGQPGNGINDSYVPPVTANRVTADQSLDVESTRDPRSPVAQAIEQAGSEQDTIFGQLKSLRITKRGKPFASQKEAQLASRKTETPIALPEGGFGVVDKAELEQVQASQASVMQPSSNAGQLGQSAAPTAPVMNEGSKQPEASQVNHDSNEAPGSDVGNGFKAGPHKGEKYRVGTTNTTGEENGTPILEKRMPGGTAATFYVGKDGNLLDADNVVFNKESSKERVWRPASKEQTAEAASILDEMGKLDLNDPKRAELKVKLKALVLGETTSTIKPSMQAEASQNQSITEISQEERNRAIENRASSYDRLANEQDELGDLGDKELAAKYRAKAEEVRQRKSTSQPNADQEAVTPTNTTPRAEGDIRGMSYAIVGKDGDIKSSGSIPLLGDPNHETSQLNYYQAMTDKLGGSLYLGESNSTKINENEPLIMGRTWQEIQAAQQGKLDTKHITGKMPKNSVLVYSAQGQPQPASNAEPISEADLKDFDLLKEHAGKWKYRYAVGANWQTANSKESAIERAQEAHQKAIANGEPLPTKAERYATSEAEQTAQMEQRYGKMSIPELEKEHSRLGGVVSDLRQTGKNEFNGNGGRRTGAATANEGARDAGLEKMRLEGYIQARKERESVTGNNENSQGINENSLANSPETTAIKPEKTIEDHFKDLSKYQSGEMDFDEFKQAASDFLDNEESVKAKLAMLTKPEILKRMGPMFNYNHKGDKKDVIVDAAYQSLAGQLRFAAQGDKDVITETVSFEEIQGKRARKTTASKAREEIAALTSEKYGIYQEKAKAATKKAEERFQKVKQQITDPQTLDDFETFLNYRSIDKLTPEQKARYEDLKAERNLDKLDQAAAAAKETKVVPTATGDIVKTKHTKEGHDLFVVKLADRVDRDAYTTINAKAKELGGYYSKFRGDGAVPGFQFRTEEQAKEFQQWLSNAGNQTTSVEDVKATTDITAEPEVTSDESSKKKQADKLRDRAASVREKAQAELNADRKSNTVKRAREAAYAVARAEADLRFANILDAIANGIEAGEIKYLRNMTAGTQLETLDTVLRRIVRSNKMSQAIRDDLIQKGYLRKGDDAELSWTDSAPIEVITQYAEMPGMDYWANILRDTAKNMQTTAGFKQAGVKIMNQVLMAINAENRMVTISDPDLIDKLKQFSKQHEVRDYLKDTMADYDRLVRMGITSPIELRAALRELHKVKQSLKGTQPKRDPVKQKEDALKMRLLNNRNAFVDFFPTPDEHANDVIARAGIEPGMRVLEPSAGHGALAVAARDAGATVDAVELSNDLRDILTEKGFNLVGSDFMATEPAGEYDAVVMNPPFSNDMDIDHVKHAYAHLKPGGRLVAIVSSMAGERSNNKNKQFKEWLDSLGATEEMMPEGSFKNSMNPTSVRTKIIELQKPSDSKNVKNQPIGSRVTIHTPKGKPVEVQYQLVSAADLVASNEFDGRVNKSYPQELQPRDRTKASYQQQVNQIAANPEGSRLAGSPESDRGAPIVRDLVVESGNGRTIGIKQAYKQGTANEYRDYLIKHADEFGFTADDVNLIDDPVLVRQRVSELSPEERLDFVVDSNTDAKMANSATEDAKADARYLDNGLMDMLNIPEGGDLLAASNERFLSSFATKLGVNSLNIYKDSAGRWNEAFRKRVSNAIFAYGYDNDTLLKSATGDTSEAGKNLTNALMNNAAKVAELRSMVPDTAKTFVSYLAEGIDVMTSAKRNGQSIQEVVNQGDMLSGGVSHYGGAMAEMLADASRSGKRLTEILNQITGMLNESAKAADQIDLLTGEPTQQVTAEEAINAAEKDFNERKDQEQRVRPGQDLFGANPTRIGDNNGSGASVSRPVSESETESTGENNGLTLADIRIPTIDKTMNDEYNRVAHVWGKTDFNESLKSTAQNLIDSLSDPKKHLLDTKEQRDYAASAINTYLSNEAKQIKADIASAQSNPSWIVTGRSNRDMKKYNAAIDKEAAKLSAHVKSQQEDWAHIRSKLDQMKPQEVKTKELFTFVSAKLGAAISSIAEYMRDGRSALEKDTRKWASPDAGKFITQLIAIDREATLSALAKVDDSLQDVGGLVKVLGSRSAAGKLVNGLLGGETEKVQFSKMPLNAAEKSGKGMTKPEAELAAKEWLKRFKTDVQVKVAKDQAEFDQLLTEAGQGGTLNADEIANAAYLPESKTLLLNASAIQNPARLRQLMRHEILGHHGLEYVIGKGAVKYILQILKNGYATSKAIRDAVDTVAANYADADVKTKIKEAFAHYAENRPVDQGPLGRLWDRVVSAVKSALVKAGFIRVNEAEQQMDSILKVIAENMRNGKEQQSAILVKNKAEFSLNVNKEPIPPEVGYQSWDLIDENSDYYDGEDYALIEKIYVRPSYRRQGYARKLVREAISEIQNEYPGLPIRLAADPQNAVGTEKIYSEDLVRFYETEGFDVIDSSGDMPFVLMEYTGRKSTSGSPGKKTYFSKGKNGDTSAYGQASSLLKESGSSLVNWLKQQRGRGLGTLTDLQIDQIYRDITGGAVNRYQKLRSKMESDRNDILLEAETKYEPMWEAMPEKEKAALSQLMYDATMSRLHPDKPLEDNSLYKEAKDKLAKARTEKTKAEYQAELDIIRNNYRNLSERYRLSSKQSKELYGTMRDLYAKQWETLRKAIEQRIEDQLGEGGKALASQMRLRMEHALQHGPYFPLARFGDYVVKARKGDEYIREHFEKRKDAEAALKQYRGEGYNAVMTVKETRAGDQANAHALGMEVIEALDKAQAEGTAPAELKDTVWQAMLDMLPDASYAKHAIHRKRIKGASRDGHRAYLQSVYHFAHHVSKIRYGHQMKAELDGMKEQVQLAVQGEESNIKPDEAEIAQQVLNEMNLRHEMNMNPKGSALAGQLGNLGFMFYLGASPASAMVNLTQNVTVMLPQLAGKYGFVKAAKFMLQAMVDYMRHGVFQKGTKEAWVSLTRATNAAITADEKAMLNKLYKAGVLDLTQAHSIAARADTDQQNIKPGKQWARTGMRWAGAMFHNAEVLNREVAALTAYRLMKEQQPGIASDVLKGDSAAIDQVAEMVYDGHGNYAASNRPRYMRGDVMKVLTQFKIYSQMMTYTLARNAVLAAKGDKTALKTLGVMFGTTWMMAGMMGMPTPVGLILYGLASLFDDDDDRTGEASFRLGLTEVFGAEVGELIAKGPVDAISGLNISGRTGLSDLWWRSPKEGTEGDDLTFHYVQQIAGPVLGIGVSAVRGMREFANGDIQRGVEAMSPKAVKDLAKAYRQASEGEQTRNGDSVIDDVGAWNVAMQAMGFSSAQMAKVYSAREYIKGKEKIIEDRRSNLLADYFTAMREQDTDAMQDVMNNIREFNASHNKAEAITGKTLKQSMKSRERSGERTQAGTYLSSKREYLRSEGAFLKQE